MTRELRFHGEALSEIRSAAGWYDRQRRGLGDEFLDALQVRLLQVLDAPTLAARLPGAPPEFPIRRVLLSRFPYAIIFVEAEGEAGNPFAGILLTSAQTVEDAEWLGGPRAPDTLHLHLTTFGPSIRTWAHGYHLVAWAPEHAKEEWSFFETDQGSGSELVRSVHYGVHCVRIASPKPGVEPANDAEFQLRVKEALARIDREQNVLAERAPGLTRFLPDH